MVFKRRGFPMHATKSTRSPIKDKAGPMGHSTDEEGVRTHVDGTPHDEGNVDWEGSKSTDIGDITSYFDSDEEVAQTKKKEQEEEIITDYTSGNWEIIDEETGEMRPAVLDTEGNFVRWKTSEELRKGSMWPIDKIK